MLPAFRSGSAGVVRVKTVDRRFQNEVDESLGGPSSEEVPSCRIVGCEKVSVLDDEAETVSLSSRSSAETPRSSPCLRPCAIHEGSSSECIQDVFAILPEPAYVVIPSLWHEGYGVPPQAYLDKFLVGGFQDSMAPLSVGLRHSRFPSDISVPNMSKPRGFLAGADVGIVAQPPTFALKILLSAREAGCTIGESGSLIQDIQRRTGTRMHMSNRGDFYPETSLQELNIRGPSSAAVVAALQCTLDVVVQQRGVLTGGEPNVGTGKARLNTVVPRAVACALARREGIGEDLTSLAGLLVKVKWQQHMSDEVRVCLSGTITSVNAAILMIAEDLSKFAGEPWFAEWGARSGCAASVP